MTKIVIPIDEALVPIENLAEHFAVSISTIRTWVRQGHIPRNTYVKIGNTYRFKQTAVANSLLGNIDLATEGLDAPAQKDEPDNGWRSRGEQLEFDFVGGDTDNDK